MSGRVEVVLCKVREEGRGGTEKDKKCLRMN